MHLEHQGPEGKGTLGIFFGVWSKASILTFPYYFNFVVQGATDSLDLVINIFIIE